MKTSPLATLLGAAGAKKFLSQQWPDAIATSNRRLSALPEMFRTGPLESMEALSAVYSGRLQIAGGRGNDHLQFSVDNAPAAWLRRVGLTVFFGDDISPFVPGLEPWLRALEAELGAPSGIGAIRAFSSPPGGGLEAHYDQGETFLLQLKGTKRLRVSENTSYPTVQFIPGRMPSEEHAAEYQNGYPLSAPEGRVVTMREGSVLYLPRGAWHRTEAGTASFSLSICVDTPNAIDALLPVLKNLLRQSPQWRRPLIGGWGNDERGAADHLRSLLAQLGEIAPRITPEKLLDGCLKFDPEKHPLRPESRFLRSPITRLKVAGTLMGVDVGDEHFKMQITTELAPAMKWLAARRSAFSWSEILATVTPNVLNRGHLETCMRTLVGSEAVRWLGFDGWADVCSNGEHANP